MDGQKKNWRGWMVTVVNISIVSWIETKKFRKTSKAEHDIKAISVLSSEDILST
jgi:hypothetical protein